MLSDSEFKEKWHKANQTMIDYERMSRAEFDSKYPELAHINNDSDMMRRVLWEEGLR